MKRNVGNEATYRNIYKLPIYNPDKDVGGSPRGGQCLSFMRFKLDREHRLLLSAVYRNHYYTKKLLGNLIGLGRLMAFVAHGSRSARSRSCRRMPKSTPRAGTQAELRALHATCAEIFFARPDEARAA